MEFLVPVLILLYVIASVVTAVMKAGGGGRKEQSGMPRRPEGPTGEGQRADQESPKGRRVVVETTGPAGGPTMVWDEQSEEPSGSDTETQAQWSDTDSDQRRDSEWPQPGADEGLSNDELDDAFEDEDWTSERPKHKQPAAAQVQQHPVFGAVGRRRLVEGVIWSEVLRKPRGKRPWPER